MNNLTNIDIPENILKNNAFINIFRMVNNKNTINTNFRTNSNNRKFTKNYSFQSKR